MGAEDMQQPSSRWGIGLCVVSGCFHRCCILILLALETDLLAVMMAFRKPRGACCMSHQTGSWLPGKTTPHYLRSSYIRRIHAPSPPDHACYSPGAVCIIQLFTAGVECERKCCGNRHWQLGREQGRQGVMRHTFLHSWQWASPGLYPVQWACSLSLKGRTKAGFVNC